MCAWFGVGRVFYTHTHTRARTKTSWCGLRITCVCTKVCSQAGKREPMESHGVHNNNSIISDNNNNSNKPKLLLSAVCVCGSLSRPDRSSSSLSAYYTSKDR